MFIHNFKYALRTTLKNKNTLIWTLLFPIALGTFMYLAFGGLSEDNYMDVIPVAVVQEKENNVLTSVLKELSKEGEDRLLDMSVMSEENALDMLQSEEVSAIIYIDDEIELKVNSSSYESTVLRTVLEEYEKVNAVVTDIAKDDPAASLIAVSNMRQDKQFFEKVKTSDGNQDVFTNYFYAIFAMSCLFASFTASEKIQNIQANTSSLGMRRCLSPNNKFVTIIAEYLSMLIIQFAVEVITLIYLVAIGVDFGDRYLGILVILLFGSSIGISMGVILGAMPRWSKTLKEGLCVGISMFSSVLADLCASGIKYTLEKKAPIINRLNPAALISDSFYSLNVYENYDRYIGNILILGGMSAVLLFVSFLILRRNKYASV